MKIENCHMTFTEALEQYLSARELRRTVGGLRAITNQEELMKEASEHMEAYILKKESE